MFEKAVGAIAIRRAEGRFFNITSNTVVCGEHIFTEGNYTSRQRSLLLNEGEVSQKPEKKRRIYAKLKSDAVSSIFS